MWAQILGIPFERFVALQRENRLPARTDVHDTWQRSEEGFIDQYGTFYSREAAWTLVMANGQPLKRDEVYGEGALYSEHLY